MRNKIIIGLVALLIGIFVGFKLTEALGQQYIMNNLPIPKATLADKDAFIEPIKLENKVPTKELSYVNKKAKNIVLLIADGMSWSQLSAYRLLKGGPNARISMDKFPVSGIVLTHSEDALVTDSASSATAYSTGFKTKNRYLALDSEKNTLETLTERISQFGYVSSLIATSEVTHATPAAFASHVDLRWKTDEISSQMINSNVTTILGGGRQFFIPKEIGGKREDGKNLLDELKSSHVLLTNKKELVEFDNNFLGKVIGLFADEHLRNIEEPDNHEAEPTLSEMVSFALKRSESFVSNGCKGFFIMAEGSQVDWAGHVNNLDYLKSEMEDFDSAVEMVLEYAKINQDTLVIVTSDHETGGLLIEPVTPSEYTGNELKFSFNTGIGRGSHTGVPVPIYAYGPGSKNFTGTLDNTDVYRAMIEALDLSNKENSCVIN
tara:strand:- start:2656 stop:3960 length:1305 start_codon:yes stop_codon:yes gene_type:complete